MIDFTRSGRTRRAWPRGARARGAGPGSCAASVRRARYRLDFTASSLRPVSCAILRMFSRLPWRSSRILRCSPGSRSIASRTRPSAWRAWASGSGPRSSGRRLGRDVVDRDQPDPAAPAQAVVEDVPGDPVDPDHEVGLALEAVEAAVDRLEDLLAHVLGLGRVAQAPDREVVDAPEVELVELLEGARVHRLGWPRRWCGRLPSRPDSVEQASCQARSSGEIRANLAEIATGFGRVGSSGPIG